MKAYLRVTATIFGLLTLLHLWRVIAERGSLARDPWFLVITLLSAAMCGWAIRLLLRTRTPGTSSANP